MVSSCFYIGIWQCYIRNIGRMKRDSVIFQNSIGTCSILNYKQWRDVPQNIHLVAVLPSAPQLT